MKSFSEQKVGAKKAVFGPGSVLGLSPAQADVRKDKLKILETSMPYGIFEVLETIELKSGEIILLPQLTRKASTQFETPTEEELKAAEEKRLSWAAVKLAGQAKERAAEAEAKKAKAKLAADKKAAAAEQERLAAARAKKAKEAAAQKEQDDAKAKEDRIAADKAAYEASAKVVLGIMTAEEKAAFDALSPADQKAKIDGLIAGLDKAD